MHSPPLEGYFQGGGGYIKFVPAKMSKIVPAKPLFLYHEEETHPKPTHPNKSRVCIKRIRDCLRKLSPLLSGPVLRDTARLSQRYPPIARYGVFGVSTWPLGCDTPSPFSERFPRGEHAKWRCDTPPQKGYFSDTCAISYENMANGCDPPRLRYYLERVLRDMGGYLALVR